MLKNKSDDIYNLMRKYNSNTHWKGLCIQLCSYTLYRAKRWPCNLARMYVCTVLCTAATQLGAAYAGPDPEPSPGVPDLPICVTSSTTSTMRAMATTLPNTTGTMYFEYHLQTKSGVRTAPLQWRVLNAHLVYRNYVIIMSLSWPAKWASYTTLPMHPCISHHYQTEAYISYRNQSMHRPGLRDHYKFSYYHSVPGKHPPSPLHRFHLCAYIYMCTR